MDIHRRWWRSTPSFSRPSSSSMAAPLDRALRGDLVNLVEVSLRSPDFLKPGSAAVVSCQMSNMSWDVVEKSWEKKCHVTWWCRSLAQGYVGDVLGASFGRRRCWSGMMGWWITPTYGHVVRWFLPTKIVIFHRYILSLPEGTRIETLQENVVLFGLARDHI